MILNISQYIEALESNDGRFRTLSRVRPLPDEAGMPVFIMPGQRLVDFNVMAGDEPLTLRCPLRHDAESAFRLFRLGERERGLSGQFFTEWNLLKREMVLFDDDGTPIEVDILARPTPVGERFSYFMDKIVARGDAAAAMAALRSFEELAAWAERAGRSGISPRRLLVAPDGSLSLTGFSADDQSERIREMLQDAASGKRPAGLPVEGDHIATFDYNLDGENGENGEGDLKCVRDGGGWAYVDGTGRTAIDGVWLSATPFRGARAEVETPSGKGLIDRSGKAVVPPEYEELVWDAGWGIAGVMSEGRWSLVDADGTVLTSRPYDWIGECSEGLVMAQRDSKSGFLDTGGREVIPFVYDEAYSFSEGYALVSTGPDTFYIDGRGKRI